MSSKTRLVLLAFVVCLSFLSGTLRGSGSQFFIVVSVTEMESGVIDVKLRNPETGYIHSITLYIDIGAFLFHPGDRVTERHEGGRVELEPYPPGSKNMIRSPGPQTEENQNPKDGTTDAQNLVNAMNDCLKARIPYYSSPINKVVEGQTGSGYPVISSFDTGTLTVDPQRFANASSISQAMLLARPVAEYVLNLRDTTFTKDQLAQCRSTYEGPSNEQLEIYRLVGYLTRCLQVKGLIPEDDPRPLFRNTFTSGISPVGSFWQEREDEMFHGFNDYPILPACTAMDLNH